MVQFYDVVRNTNSINILYALVVQSTALKTGRGIKHFQYPDVVGCETLLERTMNLFHATSSVTGIERKRFNSLLYRITELAPKDPKIYRIVPTFKNSFSKQEWKKTFPGIAFPHEAGLPKAIQNRCLFPPEVIERAERQKSLNETLGKAPGC